ncbi:MAG: ATP-binding cassette domain-containing protein [Bacteroidota bacterium]
MTGHHSIILVDNQVNTKKLIADLIAGKYPIFAWLTQKRIGEFSLGRIERFIEEEQRHDQKVISKGAGQSLTSMSSGERKKALLRFLKHQNPEIVFVVNPYDSLDQQAQGILEEDFKRMAKETTIIQIINRISDAFPFPEHFYIARGTCIEQHKSLECLKNTSQSQRITITQRIPKPLKYKTFSLESLVEFKEVSVSFNGKAVLSKINWTIKEGEFWQLKGPNGSGKSTLLNLMTGDSHKGYGQNLMLFGHKKGSGESVWDLKEKIGYFSPTMVDRFRGHHTLEHMLISGQHDSVGLYVRPTGLEQGKAREWLELLGLGQKKQRYFHELSIGAKRLVMTARAMIKHPPLLILDEPTVGLDDSSATFFVDLINTYAKESASTVVFVSHREEKGLRPNQIFELVPGTKGSRGFPNYT